MSVLDVNQYQITVTGAVYSQLKPFKLFVFSVFWGTNRNILIPFFLLRVADVVGQETAVLGLKKVTFVISCPGSSIPTLGWLVNDWLTATLEYQTIWPCSPWPWPLSPPRPPWPLWAPSPWPWLWPESVFKIVMSGQFCSLAMFFNNHVQLSLYKISVKIIFGR